MRRLTPLVCSTIISILIAVPLAAGPLEGEWLLREEDSTSMILTLNYRETSSTGNWHEQTSRTVARESLQKLDSASFASRTGAPISFELRREAGTFLCEGWSRDGRASGHFTFVPDKAFARELDSLGFGTPSDRESLSLALSDTGVDLVREIAHAGWDGVTVSQLVRASHHGITAEYVRGIHGLGFRPVSLDAITRMRDHGVTVEFVREIMELGIAEVDEQGIVRLRDHGVTPEFIRGMKAAGFAGLDARQLVRLRDHGVTPEYARTMTEAMSRSLTPEELVRLRDHGVNGNDVSQIRGRR